MDKRNISVASKNGYTFEKVMLAKRYLDEIGDNRRTFDSVRLVEMYNEVRGTHETAVGCKPCAMNKFYNGLMNYYTYGKMTLINSGIAKEGDFDTLKEEEPKGIENEENRIVLNDDEVEDEKPRKKGKKQ